MKEIYFNKFFKIANYCSIFLIIISVLLLFFKGLNFGVDFRGGTLIELRVNDKNINITTIRDYCKEINLDGSTVMIKMVRLYLIYDLVKDLKKLF